MKKILLFLMVFSLTIPFLSGCKKEEDPNIWQDGEYVDVVEPNDIIVENEDRNLAGKLYTEENKPEGSEEITVYRLKDDSLQPEEHKSFALPENIKIQYLLDTLEAFAAFKTVELKGTVIGDTAIVNINDRYQLLAWMTNQYPDDTYKYNTPPEGIEGTDELIRRCGGYRRKGEGGVLVKLRKPQQDMRIDLPTIGTRTVERAKESGLQGIVVHSGNSLIVDEAEVIKLADKYGIFVMGVTPDEKI